MHPTQPLHVQAEVLQRGKPVIALTQLEDAICSLIDDACRWIVHVQPQPDAQESDNFRINYTPEWSLEARVAGGWVRDKLLGQASNDLDVSLSTLTGHIFALLLRQYLLSDAFLQSSLATDPMSPFYSNANTSTKNELVGHITKIAANPEQSKNLETATAKLAGLQIDFVNLRKEAYIGSSRIPIMTFGSATEDAERRDITINAIFYNVHTRQVEDLTGKGLDDMRSGIIRTPLEPHQTFLDDPLRVLRCVRFASRFGYTIHDDIFRCLTGDEGIAIRQALTNKVSRERFGIEIEKMMEGPDPARAIETLFSLSLFEIVFGPPPGSIVRDAQATPNSQPTWRAIALLEAMWTEAHAREKHSSTEVLSSRTTCVNSELLSNTQVRSHLFYSAALLHLRGAEWQEKKDKWFWAGDCVVLNGLKRGRSTREILSTMHRSAKLLQRPTEDVFQWTSNEYRGKQLPFFAGATSEEMQGKTPISERATRVLLLRSLRCKPETGMSTETMMAMNLLWAKISDLACDPALWSACSSAKQTYERAKEEAQRVLSSPVAGIYTALFGRLLTDSAFERLNERALLNGKEVMDLLKIPPGALVQQVLVYVEAWQFDQDPGVVQNDQAKEQCQAWLQDQWTQGGIVPFDQRNASKIAPLKKKQKGT